MLWQIFTHTPSDIPRRRNPTDLLRREGNISRQTRRLSESTVVSCANEHSNEYYYSAVGVIESFTHALSFRRRLRNCIRTSNGSIVIGESDKLFETEDVVQTKGLTSRGMVR